MKGWKEYKELFYKSLKDIILPIIDQTKIRKSTSLIGSLKPRFTHTFFEMGWCVDLELDEDALPEISFVDNIGSKPLIIIGMGVNTWNIFKDFHYKVLKEIQQFAWKFILREKKEEPFENIMCQDTYSQIDNVVHIKMYANLKEVESTSGGWF